jgi:hypothetical protein
MEQILAMEVANPVVSCVEHIKIFTRFLQPLLQQAQNNTQMNDSSSSYLMMKNAVLFGEEDDDELLLLSCTDSTMLNEESMMLLESPAHVNDSIVMNTPPKSIRHLEVLNDTPAIKVCSNYEQQSTLPPPPPLPQSKPTLSILQRLLDEKEKRFWKNLACNEARLYQQLNSFQILLRK